MIVRKMIVELNKQTKTNTLEVKKSHEKSLIIDFTILQNGKAYDMAEVKIAAIKGVKPDGSYIYVDGEIETDEQGENINVVRFTFPQDCYGVTGRYVFEVELADENSNTVSFDFYINVINELYSDDDIYSVDEKSGVLVNVARALSAAEKTSEDREVVEAARDVVTSAEANVITLAEEVEANTKTVEADRQIVSDCKDIAIEKANQAARDAAISTEKREDIEKYADIAKTYAVGTSEATERGTDTHNSMYYAMRSKENKESTESMLNEVRQYAGLIVPRVYFDPENALLYTEDVENPLIDFYFDDETKKLYWRYVA